MTTGLVGSLRSILDKSLGALQHRLELLGLELREEKSRFVELLLLTLGAFFLALMALGTFTVLVVFLCSAQYRLYAAGAFFVLYLGGACWSFRTLRTRLNRYPLAFSTTAQELEKDREWIHSFK